ncbi:lipid A deacylase LpxR family protein [Fibrella sp. HMF5335]|uniref:Lipid A deacylase LpxR family protein n=1 Tax=Fibrella rubiginis TaxID=2817060 RepID=A0A939GFY2_9BACT|nr:lipid A deacylase LpxR family protein [Fibrella rubiginis]MBO0936006.1 lipid A deacylase LpxR family protein [Fibrella rubiginis]
MRLLLVVACLLNALTTFSQDASRPKPIHKQQAGAFAQLDWENDAFQVHQRSVTDRYYSNGIRLTHLSNYWQKWPTHYALLRLNPKDKRSYKALYNASVGQELYTPRDTRSVRPPLYPYDRPYAGYLYVAWGLTTTDPTGGRRLSSSLALGVIGPASGAAELQDHMHGLLHQAVPAGWGTQMKNDPVISYTVRYEGRAIPLFSPVFDVISEVEGTIGSLMNAAGMGGTLRVGLFNDYFGHPTGLYSAGTSPRKFQCYAFIRIGFRAVLDNSLMQGGWLNGAKNYYALPAVELQHFYGQTDVGGVIAGKNMQLTFIQHVRTPEFVGALSDQWGHLALLVRVGK